MLRRHTRKGLPPAAEKGGPRHNLGKEGGEVYFLKFPRLVTQRVQTPREGGTEVGENFRDSLEKNTDSLRRGLNLNLSELLRFYIE